MSRIKHVFAIVLVLSMAFLGGCETTKGGTSPRGSSGHVHQH